MPNQVSNVSFGSPYAAEQMEIQRRQKLAQMLQQQSMEPIQQQQGGMFTPRTGWAQMLAKGVQAYAGKKGMTDTTTQQAELAQRMQQERQQALAQAMMQGQGSPQPAPEQGGGPAMPPDPMGAAQSLAGANDPALQQAGIGMMGKQFEAQMPQRPPNPQEMAFRQKEFDATREATEAAAGMASADRLQREQAARQQQGDMARLTASLRTPPQQRQQQVIQTAQGPMILGDDGKLKPITGPGGQQVQAPAGGHGGPMSATAQRELIETEEQIQGGQSAIDLFKQAAAINDKAMGFTGAGALASAGSLLPNAIRPSTVEATQNLDNILQTAALPQLKAIFGGMPTEGERKILLDVQGSSSKPASVRKDIFERAEKSIKARMKFAGEKAKRLREGTYFTGEGLPSIQQDMGAQATTPQRRADDKMPSGVRVTRIQ